MARAKSFNLPVLPTPCRGLKYFNLVLALLLLLPHAVLGERRNLGGGAVAVSAISSSASAASTRRAGATSLAIAGGARSSNRRASVSRASRPCAASAEHCNVAIGDRSGAARDSF